VRELWPVPTEDVEVERAYADEARRPPQTGRPWVMVNMIASVDGAVAVDGRSGDLGGAGDKAVFRALRSLPDVIVVGAATVRAERYGPPRPTEEVRAARRGRGQTAVPRLVVVSGSLEIDPTLGLFAEAEVAPLVVTTAHADHERAARLAEVAEVLRLPGDRVEPTALLAHLAASGAGVALCEGGPTLNGQMVAAGVVDEWCTTVAPLLVSGEAGRVARGAAPAAPERLALRRVLGDDDGYLFLRYLAAR
jgi:riboflavin biosynthesis pyrimidine reductase